jgi:hypothetical protein
MEHLLCARWPSVVGSWDKAMTRQARKGMYLCFRLRRRQCAHVGTTRQLSRALSESDWLVRACGGGTLELRSWCVTVLGTEYHGQGE